MKTRKKITAGLALIASLGLTNTAFAVAVTPTKILSTDTIINSGNRDYRGGYAIDTNAKALTIGPSAIVQGTISNSGAASTITIDDGVLVGAITGANASALTIKNDGAWYLDADNTVTPVVSAASTVGALTLTDADIYMGRVSIGTNNIYTTLNTDSITSTGFDGNSIYLQVDANFLDGNKITNTGALTGNKVKVYARINNDSNGDIAKGQAFQFYTGAAVNTGSMVLSNSNGVIDAGVYAVRGKIDKVANDYTIIATSDKFLSNTAIQALAFTPSSMFWEAETEAIDRHLATTSRDKKLSVWIEPYVQYNTVEIRELGDVDKTLAGFMVGYDALINLGSSGSTLLAGVTASYGLSMHKLSGQDNSTDSVAAGLYASYKNPSAVFVDLQVRVNSYSNDYNAKTSDDFSRSTRYSQLGYGVGVRTGRDFLAGGFKITPEARVDFLAILGENYAIPGEYLVKIDDYYTLTPNLGVRADRKFAVGKGSISPYARIGVGYRVLSESNMNLDGITFTSDASGYYVDFALGAKYLITPNNAVSLEVETGFGQALYTPIGGSLSYEFTF